MKRDLSQMKLESETYAYSGNVARLVVSLLSQTEDKVVVILHLALRVESHSTVRLSAFQMTTS
jgi:hypothetical protein